MLADLERVQDQDLLALRNVGEDSVIGLINALRYVLHDGDADVMTSLPKTLPSEALLDGNALDQVQAPLQDDKPANTRPAPIAQSTLREAIRIAIRETKWSRPLKTAICLLRIETPEGATLQEVADQVGLTRERVRQIVTASLKSVGNQPVGKAIQWRLNALLEAHECVRVEDICELDPWFNSLPAPGLWVVLDTLHSDRTWIFNGLRLVSRVPRAEVEKAILSTIEELSVATPDQARASLGAICKRVAAEAGAPGLEFLLGAIGESRLAERRIKLSDFVKDYVLQQTAPFELEPLCQAARLRGLELTENVARNAVAATADVYAVGKSTFATSGMLFGIPSEDREKAAALAEKLIESRPERQFHAEELLLAIGDELGIPALAAVGDVHRLSALLRFRNNVRSLGRLIFTSKSAAKDTERLELLPLAQRILGEVGHPLDEGDLLRRMSEVRGIGRFSIQALLSGLTQIQPNIYWLDDQWRPKVSFEDEMLLEDVYSVVSPGEVLSAIEIRRRLAQRTGERALEIAPNHLRTLVAGDDRFTSVSGGLISLKNIPNRRNPFDAVAS